MAPVTVPVELLAVGIGLFIVVAYIVFQLTVWARPAPPQVVVNTVPPNAPTDGCAMALGTLVLFVLIGVIAFLLVTDPAVAAGFVR
jgi:hypothetical protein